LRKMLDDNPEYQLTQVKQDINKVLQARGMKERV